jgi:hypothetical protein
VKKLEWEMGKLGSALLGGEMGKTGISRLGGTLWVREEFGKGGAGVYYHSYY